MATLASQHLVVGLDVLCKHGRNRSGDTSLNDVECLLSLVTDLQ